MEDVVAAARRIEKILDKQTDTNMERLVSTKQEQIQFLKKDLKEANEQIAAHRTTAPPVAAMAAVPATTAATAAATQLPPAAPAHHIYQDYSEEPPFYRPPCGQMDRCPSTFLPLRRRRPLRVQLSCSPSPSTPPPPASTCQPPCPASRTNTGAASQRGRLAPSPPSLTSACPSGYTLTRRPQVSAQSSLKSEKAKNASFAAPPDPSTKQRKRIPPPSWSVSPSSGPSQSSDLI